MVDNERKHFIQNLPVGQSSSELELHSLNFTNSNTGGDMAIDLHTTAELVESFDIDEFMEAVDSVRSTATITPQMRDQDSTSDGSDDMVDDCGSDAPIAAHDEETKKKPRRARRVTSKEHILKLREIVKQLTKQLDALKTETRPGVQSNATKDGRLIRSSSTSLWMQAALRQRERRRKAEADNDSLREMLQMQIEEASCLKRILKRRAKIKLMEDMVGITSTIAPCMPIICAPDDNTQIIQQLLHGCNEFYADVDKRFQENGVNDVTYPGQKRQVERTIINGDFHDIMLQSRVPFGFQETTKAMWAFLTNLRKRGQQKIKIFKKNVDNHVQYSDGSVDTLMSSYFAASPNFGEISGAQVREVVRQYVEEDRAVFVCSTLVQPKLRGCDSSAGFQLCTTLRVVIDSTSNSLSNPDIPTRIRIHFTESRRDLCMPHSPKFRGPADLDVSISLWDALISRIPEEVENYLIDHSHVHHLT